MTEQYKHDKNENVEPPENGSTQESQTASQQVGDLLGGALFAALGVFAIVAALGMPRRGSLGFFTSPGFVPLLLGMLLVFLCGILVYRSLRKGALGGVGGWIGAKVGS